MSKFELALSTAFSFCSLLPVNIVTDQSGSLLKASIILFALKFTSFKLGLLNIKDGKDLLYFPLTALLLFFVFILSGAPLLIWLDKTAALSLFTAVLLMEPLMWLKYEGPSLQIFGSLIGAWVGAFLLPLDWQGNLQIYPIPVVYGSLLGNLLAVIYILIVL